VHTGHVHGRRFVGQAVRDPLSACWEACWTRNASMCCQGGWGWHVSYQRQGVSTPRPRPQQPSRMAICVTEWPPPYGRTAISQDVAVRPQPGQTCPRPEPRQRPRRDRLSDVPPMTPPARRWPPGARQTFTRREHDSTILRGLLICRAIPPPQARPTTIIFITSAWRSISRPGAFVSMGCCARHRRARLPSERRFGYRSTRSSCSWIGAMTCMWTSPYQPSSIWSNYWTRSWPRWGRRFCPERRVGLG
jgi:hypothetical protein